MARQRWLVLFNCQAAGLAHCLSLQCAGIDVEFHDPVSTAQNSAQIVLSLDSYDRILVADGCAEELSLKHRENVWVIPAIRFHALHPDLCWLGAEFGKGEGSTRSDWHSLIAYTAFTLGLDLQQALALYRDDVYSELGYYAQWDREAKAFYERYEQFGFDMTGSLTKWSRAGAFMYLPIHPTIECLNDLARAILRRAGLAMTDSALRPQDNLVGGPVFPVYPEVGRRLGIAGDYLFKLGARYRLFVLRAFVDQSYRGYARFADLSPSDPCFTQALRRARRVIAAKAGIAAPRDVVSAPIAAELG